MNGQRVRVGILSILFILSISSSGQVPQIINYQGRLLTGTNLANGTFGLSLRLFNVPSGGSKIYEDSNSVAVADGLYSTFIGDTPPDNSFLNALTNATVYVEVAVNNTALAPRERLASVGYSLATRGLLVDDANIVMFNPALNAIHPGSFYSTIGGGHGNSIQDFAARSFLGGGSFNHIHPIAGDSFLGGGSFNNIRSNTSHAVLGGGFVNSIGPNAPYSTIPGGQNNSVGDKATNAFAAGYRAKANHQGAFVWADNQEADFASTAANQFLIRAAGGVGIGIESAQAQLHVVATNALVFGTAAFESSSAGTQISHIHYGPNGDWYIRSAATNGTVILQDVGGNVGIGITTPTNKLHVVGNVQATAFITASDRNMKENFAAVDANDVLEKIAAMPISRWNFKTEPTVQHVGPMAQDFRAAFGLGQNDTTIATVDESGVAFAAIQELVRQNKELRQEVAELKSRVDTLAP